MKQAGREHTELFLAVYLLGPMRLCAEFILGEGTQGVSLLLFIRPSECGCCEIRPQFK